MNYDVNLRKECEKRNINYLSFSILHKGKPVISQCNSREWQAYYNDKYLDLNTGPPVKKYIEASSHKILIWNLLDLDASTEDYIGLRNEWVKVKTNISFINKTATDLSVFGLGSSLNPSDFMETLRNDLEFFLYLQHSGFLGNYFFS